MNLNLSPLTIENFLTNYWQQKPIVIRSGISDFINPVEPDELAGLASEANIESRLISFQNHQWNAESGPFTDYQAYGESAWTLVVQSVNHWIPAAQDFARLFDFIPQWRFDDVMVSFATPNGSVGPHKDNYDVFICQGSGQRHWRVGNKMYGKDIIAHEKLLHVEPFTAIIDEVLNAGDILYIPPGFPHEGISLDSSMSFSVGYKSTNRVELLSSFADYLIDFANAPALLSDKQRSITRYGQINSEDFEQLLTFLQKTINDKKQFSDFLGIHYSLSTSELDLAQEEYDYQEWLMAFTYQPLHKLHAVKTLYIEETVSDGIFYLDGERQKLSIEPEMIRHLCDASQIHYEDFAQLVDNTEPLSWLWESTNRGYWYFSTP